MRNAPLALSCALLAVGSAGCGSTASSRSEAPGYVITLTVGPDGVVREEPLHGRSEPRQEVAYEAELALLHVRERDGSEQDLTAALQTVVVSAGGEVLLDGAQVAEHAVEVRVVEVGERGSRLSGRPPGDVVADVARVALSVLLLAGALLSFGLLFRYGVWGEPIEPSIGPY